MNKQEIAELIRKNFDQMINIIVKENFSIPIKLLISIKDVNDYDTILTVLDVNSKVAVYVRISIMDYYQVNRNSLKRNVTDYNIFRALSRSVLNQLMMKVQENKSR